MRSTFKALVKDLLQVKPVWNGIQSGRRFVDRLATRLETLRTADEGQFQQHRAVEEQFAAKCQALCAGLTVLNGPFKGMKYPTSQSAGSTFYPKILGSYEKELHEVIERQAAQRYDVIVDIGCAEGYYAVGYGMRTPAARILAFDTNADALQLCREMARLNSVEVVTSGFCDKQTLQNLDLGARALIFCDCEGYENALFDRSMAHHLRAHDLLIESHDFIDLETTRRMLEAFSDSHDCRIVASVDDILKAYHYDYPELVDFSLEEKRRLLAEDRPGTMRWVCVTSRNQTLS